MWFSSLSTVSEIDPLSSSTHRLHLAAMHLKQALNTSGLLQPGSRLDRYEIISRLAQGGMAEIWLSVLEGTQGFQKRVVLKTILPHFAQHQELVRLFINEASIAALLTHPNIVTVFDFGQLEGTYFMAMEYVPGKTLRDFIRRLKRDKKVFPTWALLRILEELCEGLQYVHDYVDSAGRPLGLIHRDVSPDNLMITFTGAVKLLDFGVANSVIDPGDSAVFVGKGSYMAPERIRQGPCDRRSDLFSAGVLLFEALTGEKPFVGDPRVVLHQIAAGVTRDPREVVPSIPAELARITLKAMAPDADYRYSEARELAADLATYLRVCHPESVRASVAGFACEVFPEAEDIPSTVRRQLKERAAPELSIEVEVEAPPEPATTIATQFQLPTPPPLAIVASREPAPLDIFPTARPRSPVPAVEVDFFNGTRSRLPPRREPTTWAPPRSPRSQPPLGERVFATDGQDASARDAARSFEKGLELVTRREYRLALDEWQRALELQPDNRLYASNLRRLRQRLSREEQS